MSLTVTSRHRDEALVVPPAQYPVISGPLSDTPGQLVFPVFGSDLRTGIRYSLTPQSASTLRATPTAPVGATLLNTVTSFELRLAPGVRATTTAKKGAPPEIVFTGALPASGGQLGVLWLDLDAIWPMRGKISYGGASIPSALQQIHKDLEAFGDPVELFVLRRYLAQHVDALGILRVDVEQGDQPCAEFLAAHGVDDVLNAVFDVMGPVARFKQTSTVDPMVLTLERSTTASYRRALELRV